MISTPMKRLMAHGLDMIVNFVVGMVILLMIKLPVIAFIKKNIGKEFNLSMVLDGGIYISYVLAVLFCVALIQLYFWNKATSVGKMMLNMTVVDRDTKRPAGFGTMLLRELIGKHISGLMSGLGFVWILVDENNQGLHDKIFNTLVVER